MARDDTKMVKCPRCGNNRMDRVKVELEEKYSGYLCRQCGGLFKEESFEKRDEKKEE